MKTKGKYNLKDKNNSKIKRQVSIITVFLWIFLVATIVTIITGNIKNTSALENDNVKIYEENVKLNKIVDKPDIEIINNFVNEIELEYRCRESGELAYNTMFYSPSAYKSAIKIGDVVANEGEDEISPVKYPWICDLKINYDSVILNFNLSNEYGGFFFDDRVKHWIVSTNKPFVRLYYSLEENSWTLGPDMIETEVKIKDEILVSHIVPPYTVKYTDGVDNENIFEDRVFPELYENGDMPQFLDVISRKGYKFIGWSPKVKDIVDSKDADENNVITYTAMWEEIYPPEYNDLSNILGDFVKIHCVSKHIEEEKLYSILNSSGDINIGKLYYSDEMQLDLCDIIINGEEYVKKYSEYIDEEHYILKDDSTNEPAELEEEKQKILTLYFDKESNSWKLLDETKSLVVFNVICKNTKISKLYNVKHEYYLKEKNNKIILEGTYNVGIESILIEYNQVLSIGISNENDIVDVEIEKKPNYTINGVEYVYEYFENSGNIVIKGDKEDTIKEITLKYIREEQEKIEDDNEIIKEENADTSDINIWMYVVIAIISIVVIIMAIVFVRKNNKNSK